MKRRWDLTTRKRASRKYRIVKCPVCGKYGQVKFYTGTSKTEKLAGCVDHRGHVELGMFNMIDESCTLNLEQANKIRDWLRG
jgi:hypothetical protein